MMDPETAAGKAQRFLMDVTRMMGVEVSVAASTDEEGNVRVDMHGDTLGILIGRRGETLDALQYLTNLAANKGLAEDKVRIIIDVENYRSRREETLRRLALRLADRVRHSGEKIILEPMNRHERKVIHTALQDNRRVVTYSDGEEPYRKVVIDLKHHKSVN